MNLDKHDIVSIYRILKERALLAFYLNNFDKCLKYIEVSTQIAYRFSWIYKDDDYEVLIKRISEFLLKPVKNYTPDVNRYVFYDSFSCDNKGLTQQYIRALISQGVNFLYITESSRRNNYSQNIFNEIAKYNKAVIFEIPLNITKRKKINIVYEQILSYKPSKLFMHLSPNAICPLVAISGLPKAIIKYQINLTDHAFWLGASTLDYSFEFRPYGCSISQRERSIHSAQILHLPFYPIASEKKFMGFPEECKDKIVVFSGGTYPKILGEDNFFLKLVKQLLFENDNAVFLFAGSGDSIMVEKFIRKNNLSKKFFLLGNRSDINEVFKNCDIYMTTYPIGGGLMAQLAAINAKPIISYSTVDKISSWPEETICQKKKIKITHTNTDEFLSDARYMISDIKYRSSIGKELKECLFSIEDFNNTFKKSIQTHLNQIPFKTEHVNVDFLLKHNIELEKENNGLKIYLFKSLKFGVFFISPKIILWSFTYLFSTDFRTKVRNKISLYTKKSNKLMS